MWKIITERKINENNIEYNAYGVKLGDCSIPDICCDSEEIARFVDLLNKFDVSPINARDVVEDYLAAL